MLIPVAPAVPGPAMPSSCPSESSPPSRTGDTTWRSSLRAPLAGTRPSFEAAQLPGKVVAGPDRELRAQ